MTTIKKHARILTYAKELLAKNFHPSDDVEKLIEDFSKCIKASVIIDDECEKYVSIISNNPDNGEISSFCILGNTYPLKKQLRANGWVWDAKNKHWKIIDVGKSDSRIKMFSKINGIEIRELSND